MLRLLGKQRQQVALHEHSPYILDLSKLKPGELLEFRYDVDQRLSSIRKLSLLLPGGVAKAEGAIQPGGLGRVTWQGSSWQACCEGEQAIAKDQTVFVLAQHDLTLYVTAAPQPW